MGRFPVLLLIVLVVSCAAPPPPAVVPEAPPPPPPAPVVESVLHNVTVTASALNVRREPSTDAEVVVQLKKGAVLGVLREGNGWVRVRLSDGAEGWVADRFVQREGTSRAKSKPKKGSCPADSDFAFEETPVLAFSDSGAHGMVVVEALVSTKGVVTGTKVITNSTGDETLAFLAEREIKSARFTVPIRNCVPRSFIFTYRRTF